LLVTMGGGDPENVTTRVLQAFAGGKCEQPVTLRIVLGCHNRHEEAVRNAIAGSRLDAEVIRNASDAQMADCMLWADAAVSAAGSTVWELGMLRVPCVQVILADNQRGIARASLQKGLCCAVLDATASTDDVDLWRECLQRFLSDDEGRQQVRRTQAGLIDGSGARTVLKQMLFGEISLRLANEADARLLWQWANDPQTRANSLTSAPIPWPEHAAWFQGKINSPGARYFIAQSGRNIELGLIRFDLAADVATIGITVAPEYRGWGLASILIGKGIAQMREAVSVFHAVIRNANTASRRAFERNGFVKIPDEKLESGDCSRYCFR